MQSPVGGGIFTAATNIPPLRGLTVLQICRPYGAWIGAFPKSVIIRNFSFIFVHGAKPRFLRNEVKIIFSVDSE